MWWMWDRGVERSASSCLKTRMRPWRVAWTCRIGSVIRPTRGRIQTLVAGSLTLAADLQVRAGELDAAIAAYDDALSLLAGSEELKRRGVHATLLLETGRALGNDQRREGVWNVAASARTRERNAP